MQIPIKTAKKTVGLVVVLCGAVVASLNYFDTKYVNAETGLIMQKSIDTLQKSFELNVLRQEASQLRSEMREYRKNYGFNLETASQFEKEEYKKLENELNRVSNEYNLLKAKK